MTVDILTAEPKAQSDSRSGSPSGAQSGSEAAPVGSVAGSSVDDTTEPAADVSAEPTDVTAATTEDKPKRGRAKAAPAKKTKTLELTLTVTGTADGEWHAELKQGSTWIARGLPVAAAAVSRAAKELHEDLSVPIDEVIDAAREQQAAKVAALEAELEAARRTLAELAD